MSILHRLAPLAFVLSIATAAELTPETAAAFDHYVKVTEDGFAKRTASTFLWLDQNREQKNLVWLGQTVIQPNKTLDNGHEIDVPGGLLQDWIGTLFLDGETINRVRDMLVNFADYKIYFREQIIESKVVKHEGDQFQAFLRFYKRQVTPIVLNTQISTLHTAVDAERDYIANRSTQIGEPVHPNKKSTYDQERSPAEAAGYLWRLNFYWRLEQADDGVYAELEMITLSRPGGGLHAGRLLSGYERFPREIAESFLDGVRTAFPRHH